MSKSNNLELKNQQRGGGREVTQSYYQGVIPSPEMMEGYRQIDPLLPMMLVNMTKDESEHRRLIERKLVRGSISSEILGLILGFLSVVAISILVYIFIIHGFGNQGATVASAVIIGLAGLFITRKLIVSSKSKDDK